VNKRPTLGSSGRAEARCSPGPKGAVNAAIETAAGYSMATTIRFRGSGPGPQSLDGCSVELWKLLPAGVEPSLIASAVPPKGSILELGARVGRITRPLLELGYRVTAVDNSSEMLAEIRGATTVLSNIEDLALSTLFVTDPRPTAKELQEHAAKIAPTVGNDTRPKQCATADKVGCKAAGTNGMDNATNL
jgi:SAM-dependent methyltransferase